MSSNAAFTFVDLFAGIGGFHAALSALGGECVYAVEKDPALPRSTSATGASTPWATSSRTPSARCAVPKHDVLAAGFPCQPFSKSGFQRGMDEARGHPVLEHLRDPARAQPTVVLLENVRNIAGPRHTHEWDVIIRSLRELGYQVSSKPIVFSPHLLPPERGGRPQVRERVFIMGTYVGKKLSSSRHRPRSARAPGRRLVSRGLGPRRPSSPRGQPRRTSSDLRLRSG